MNTDSGNYRKSVPVELEWVFRLGRNTRNKGQLVCSKKLGILSPDVLVCPILDDKYCEGSIRMSRGYTLKVKTRNVAQEVAVWRHSIGNFFEYFEGFSEHGIFHGILI
ncbi:MAG: hypothetical protein C0631_10460 [Sedimenticola sp.]|nr:MAG: hypothetical protein C0631_10460 [Sedimenticola sp.]